MPLNMTVIIIVITAFDADSTVAMMQLNEMDGRKTMSEWYTRKLLHPGTKRHRQLSCRKKTTTVSGILIQYILTIVVVAVAVAGRFGFSCDFAIVHARIQTIIRNVAVSRKRSEILTHILLSYIFGNALIKWQSIPQCIRYML